MRTFIIIWLGQVTSLVGSGLTNFAVGVWLFETTDSITHFALIGLCAALPRVIFSPLAGTLIDRWDRRRVMILSDLGAGLCTLTLVILLLAGRIAVWQIYLIVSLSATFGTIQWPAYAAVTTQLVPQKSLGHANGMRQFGQAASEILAPLLAGVLLRTFRLDGIALIDLATLLFAVLTLLAVRFPSLPAATTGRPDRTTMWDELTVGWRYVVTRKGLLGLLLFFTRVNFLWGMVGALITPMILGFTSSDVLGGIISIAGGGMLVGSIVMSVWGGPRRRINGVLLFEGLSGACFILMGFRPAFWPVALGAFGAHATIAIIYGSNQAIWQSKVALEVQGRVFAFQQMIARAAAPLAYLLAGPLAEQVFEPLLASGGPLAGTVGRVIGTGPGRGIGLLFLAMGGMKATTALVGYLHPRIRRVEEELPDAAPLHSIQSGTL
jgi:MFS family permease